MKEGLITGFIEWFKNLGKLYQISMVFVVLGGIFIYYLRQNIPATILPYVLIAYCGFAIAVFIFLVYHTRYSEAEVLFLKPRKGERYNEALYDYLDRRLQAARSQIVMTGDGFGCTDRESQRRARKYIDKYRGILDKGVSVLRVQTETKSHEIWAELLGHLLRDYPGQFELFVLREDTAQYAPAMMMAIDPEIKIHCSANIMYTSEHHHGTTKQHLASFAFAVDGDADFTKEIANRVRVLTKEQYSVQVKTPEAAKQVLCSNPVSTI